MKKAVLPLSRSPPFQKNFGEGIKKKSGNLWEKVSAFSKTEKLLSFLSEIGKPEGCRRLIFALLADAGDDECDNGYHIG